MATRMPLFPPRSHGEGRGYQNPPPIASLFHPSTPQVFKNLSRPYIGNKVMMMPKTFAENIEEFTSLNARYNGKFGETPMGKVLKAKIEAQQVVEARSKPQYKREKSEALKQAVALEGGEASEPMSEKIHKKMMDAKEEAMRALVRVPVPLEIIPEEGEIFAYEVSYGCESKSAPQSIEEKLENLFEMAGEEAMKRLVETKLRVNLVREKVIMENEGQMGGMDCGCSDVQERRLGPGMVGDQADGVMIEDSVNNNEECAANARTNAYIVSVMTKHGGGGEATG